MPDANAKTQRRILLADNNESMQRVVREVAQSRGHVLVKATVGDILPRSSLAAEIFFRTAARRLRETGGGRRSLQ